MPQGGATGAIRRTILVVDDEPIVLNFLSTALRRAGYEVIAATHGAQARALFNRYAGDLALVALEIALPDMSGPELISSLPTLEPRIPIIFLTRLGEQEITLKPLDYAAPILQKPFRAGDLKATIQRLALAMD